MREGGDGVEGLSKMVEGLMNMDNSVVVLLGRGDIMKLNGKGKNAIKIKSKT